MTKEATKTRNIVKPNLSMKEPGKFAVIYINDNVTTMEFVVNSLVEVFNHSHESAEEITNKVHTEGAGIAAILPYEMAEQKGVTVTQMARSAGYPLVIKLEPSE